MKTEDTHEAPEPYCTCSYSTRLAEPKSDAHYEALDRHYALEKRYEADGNARLAAKHRRAYWDLVMGRASA